MSNQDALADRRLISVAHSVVRHGPVDSLDEAAELRGVAPSAVIKTMVVRRADDNYVLVLVPGDRVIDWSLLRTELGQRRLSMADADEALRMTGYARGTITPFGSSTEWPVIADSRISDGVVSIGGGAPGVSVTIEGDTLLTALDATVADITKERS